MADGILESILERMRKTAADVTGFESLAPEVPKAAEVQTELGGAVSAVIDRLIAKAPKKGSAANTVDRLNAGIFQRTLDGDTLDLSRGKLRTPTRLAGIDAPESAQGTYGKDAQDYLDGLIAEAGPEKVRVGQRMIDRHGRDVATLYAGKKNLSVEMVRAGHARVYTGYLGGHDKVFQEALLEAQGEAQARGAGIWKDPEGAGDPERFRRDQVEVGAAAAGHDMRAPIDPATVTRQQAVRGVMERLYAQKMARSGGQGRELEGGGSALLFSGGGGAKRPTGGNGIPAGERQQAGSGWLDQVFGALDQLGNTSRSAIHGLATGRNVVEGAQQAVKQGYQAWNRERETSPTRLRDSLIGKHRFGKDDGQFDVGDLGDFAADVVTDLVTDPLTWVTRGVGSLVKGGGVLAKALPALHRGAVEAKVGSATADAAKFATVKRSVGAGIGASYGVGTTDSDDGIGTKLLAAAAGAGIGFFGDRAVPAIGAKVKPVMDAVSDSYAEWTRGSRFASFTKARELALAGYDKVRNVAEWIRQGRFEALKGLDAAERIQASALMAQLKTEFVRQRNNVTNKLKFPGLEGEELFKRRKEFGKLPEDHILNNKIGQVISEDIEKNFLPKLLENQADNVADGVVGWVVHNEKVVQKLNKMAFGIADGKPTTEGKGIFGVPWHIDDVYEMKDFKEAQKALGRFQIHAVRSKKRSLAAEDLALSEYRKVTGQQIEPNMVEFLKPKERQIWDGIHADALDKTYGAYTENFAKKFLDEAERKASSLMYEFSKIGPKQKPIQVVEGALGAFDKMTSFVKANMLYFSLTWLKNNYLDNIAKSWVETGVSGIVDAATFGKFRHGVSEDVAALYGGGMNRVYKAVDLRDALHRGVLDNPMYKSIEDKGTRAFLYSPEQIAQAGKMSKLERASQIVLNNPYVRWTASTGSHIEGTARLMTYIRVKEALERSPVFKGAGPEQLAKVKDMAADVVKKTFFDYGDVTHFEKATFQRLVPFYSFYSKNLPYWVQAAVDPARAGRVVAIDKMRRNVGSDPTSYDRGGMPPYILAQAPRKLGTDSAGNKVYGIAPGASMHDAFNMLNPVQWAEQAKEKGSPFIKAGIEAVTGRDLFSGGAMLPSTIGREEAAERGREQVGPGKKFLYSRGFKMYAINRAAEVLPEFVGNIVKGVTGSSAVELDGKGNPFTTSDRDVIVDKIWSTLWPMGIVDQVAGSIGKRSVGKETWAEMLLNRLAPIQQVKVSAAMERMVRNRREGGAK